ncbi:hypothetical protein Moror_4251 [Moniliophthora roreri MCA 2997]|uniref:F-box domain-containing protein n=2 Tax=Moniliophthora roreri TaxID=221103 RepID=V2XA09_MONRO|nr:hypothetical protein Moror_4251 [Moniliophthora roreri MCA 2997]KAI3602806.1 hypothetical protein WG66_008041 [Moniliophthora roreri]
MGAHGRPGYLESPFINRFGTNFAPSPEEISKIQELLDEPEKRLEALEAEISRLQSQREELKFFIDNHRSLLSPIRRISTDILREVFMRCLPEDYLPTNDICEAPLLLTSICRSWHEVAISTPRLWNRIHISLRYPLSPVNNFFRSWMQTSSEGLKLWLERSGKVPLTLSLRTSPGWGRQRGGHTYGDTAELEGLYADFFRLLFPYASRWKSLSLTVTPAVRDVLGELSVGKLTLLEEFKMNPDYITDLGAWEALSIIFRHSPSLHVLHLTGAPLELPIPWGNLTEVVLNSSFPGELLPSQAIQVLSLSSASLRRCVLHLQLSRGSVLPSQDTPVVLPYLHTLDIRFRSVRVEYTGLTSAVISELEHLFGAIVAPMLKNISLTNQAFLPEAFNRLPFLDFLRRSACSLSSLHLDLRVTAIAVVMSLQQVPSLIELKIRGVTAREWSEEAESPAPLSDFFHALTPSSMNTSAVVCPNLEIFTCTGCSPCHAASLLALAEARSGTSGGSQSQHSGVEKSLKRMKVVFRAFIEDTDTPFRLKSLREKGMWIQWSSPRDERTLLDRPLQSDRNPSREESVPIGDHSY